MGSNGQTLPFSEGFESTTFPPTGWTINNPDGADTWARSTSAYKTGTASAVMDNYTNDHSGQADDMISPMLDLTSMPNPSLAFQLAYKLYTNPSLTTNYSDTLQILISTDCGATYSSIYKKYGTNLTTTTPTWANSAFTPTSSQWRQEVISLASYSSASGAFIKFRNISDYENFLYIDDINISTTASINMQSAIQGINIYPNPSADGKFMVDIKKDEHSIQKLSVYDVLGNKVFEILNNIPAGVYDMNLANLSNGTYLVEIVKDNTTVFNKIIINK